MPQPTPRYCADFFKSFCYLTIVQFEWARTGGAMLQRFGGFDAHEVLCDEILQSPKNAFTASMTAHAPFDALKI